MSIIATKKDVIWNYLGTIASIGSAFVVLPFLIYFLSSDYLGLWYVYLALGAFVTLFEFGFSPTFARNFSYCLSGADELRREGRGIVREDGVNVELFAHLLRSSKKVYLRITLIAGVGLTIPGTIYVIFISSSLDTSVVLISWSVFVLANLINMYYLYYSAALRGIGGIAIDNKIKVVSKTCQVVVMLIALFCGFGLIGASVAYLCNSLLFRVLGYVSFWRYESIRPLQIKNQSIDDDKVEKLISIVSFNAKKDGIVQLSNYCSTQAATIICACFLSLSEAGAYSIALQFATGVGNLSLAMFNALRPMLQSAYQEDDISRVRRSIGAGVVSYIVLSVFLNVIIFVGYPILNLINPSTTFDPAVYLGVSIYMFIFNWYSLFASALCAFNIIPYVKAYAITAAVSIVFSIVLIKFCDMGVWGLVVGMMLPNLIYNCWKWPLEVLKRLHISLWQLLKLGVKRRS